MDKITNLVEKVNKYLRLEYTLKQYFIFGLLIFLCLIILFCYFEHTWSMTKNNIWKWDDVTFLKLTLYMLIPLLSVISLNFNFFNNEHLNNWVHFLSLFFIVPIFPYIFMCFYHFLYLGIKKIFSSLKKAKE